MAFPFLCIFLGHSGLMLLFHSMMLYFPTKSALFTFHDLATEGLIVCRLNAGSGPVYGLGLEEQKLPWEDRWGIISARSATFGRYEHSLKVLSLKRVKAWLYLCVERGSRGQVLSWTSTSKQGTYEGITGLGFRPGKRKLDPDQVVQCADVGGGSGVRADQGKTAVHLQGQAECQVELVMRTNTSDVGKRAGTVEGSWFRTIAAAEDVIIIIPSFYIVLLQMWKLSYTQVKWLAKVAWQVTTIIQGLPWTESPAQHIHRYLSI